MNDVLQLIAFMLLLLSLVPILGHYMMVVFRDNGPPFIPILSNLENLTYRICRIDKNHEMTWKEYAIKMLYFNLIGLIFLFLIQLFQGWLPLNPQGFASVEPFLAFNTAISFVTNTDWQAYGGENSLSYFTQMTGLTMQNFTSAATGNSVLLVLIRGITRKSTDLLGNFWVDLTRTVIYLLLPLCIVLAPILVSQGVIQNFNSYVNAKMSSGENQIIPMGPAASQVAIKQIGTNGGGFFNANSAHPFENPTPLSNFLENFAILLIPASTVYMYGLFIQSRKHSWIIFAVMSTLWIMGLTIALLSEYTVDPTLEILPVLEGKETRFSIADSILWSISTSGTSNGSVNNMLSSLSPLSGGVAMFNIMIGEVIFGGIGVGLCSMLMFILLTLFLAGLMVGRTPEYLGKKIEKNEIQCVMIAILVPCALILIGSGIACVLPSSLVSVSHIGPHGLSEILYTFASAAGNNGSSFAGLNGNTIFYNIILAIIMLLARLAILLPSLAIAGYLAQKNAMATSLGTLATDRSLFGILLLSVILIVAALSFFPAFSLGPIVEQILMLNSRVF